MKMTNEIIERIKSYHSTGMEAREISRIMYGEISLKSIWTIIRADFDIVEYHKFQVKKHRDRKYKIVPDWFKYAMVGYTIEEMKRAYDNFKRPLPMFDVVECRCTEHKMCYPHYMQYLENLYVHGIKI